MAVHDWTRVSPGTFHDFHGRWITHLSESLNAGLLPAGYYALSEQPAEDAWPDVLALEATRIAGSPWTGSSTRRPLRCARIITC